ncbi:MAG: zf-HC2 domain-containing protein [Acidimicrobiia bacterium]
MRCDDLRAAISARLDGEDPLVPGPTIDQHLSTCPPCGRWVARAAELHRLTRVRAAEAVPDLSAAIVDAAVPLPRRRLVPVGESISWARWALFVVALTQLVLAAPALLLGDSGGATVHVARELGAFDVALAAGLLVAALQPERAWGLLPLVAVLGLVVLGTALLDVVDGATPALGESHHLLDLAGVGLLWRVGREGRGPVGDRSAPRTA